MVISGMAGDKGLGDLGALSQIIVHQFIYYYYKATRYDR